VSRIVCNSGPLIALGILARLEILKSLFDEVLVPEAVQREIEQGVSIAKPTPRTAANDEL